MRALQLFLYLAELSWKLKKQNTKTIRTSRRFQDAAILKDTINGICLLLRGVNQRLKKGIFLEPHHKLKVTTAEQLNTLKVKRCLYRPKKIICSAITITYKLIDLTMESWLTYLVTIYCSHCCCDMRLIDISIVVDFWKSS